MMLGRITLMFGDALKKMEKILLTIVDALKNVKNCTYFRGCFKAKGIIPFIIEDALKKMGNITLIIEDALKKMGKVYTPS